MSTRSGPTGVQPQAHSRGPAQVRDVDPLVPGVAHVEEDPALRRGRGERRPQNRRSREGRVAAEARTVVPCRAELLLLESPVRARPPT